MRSLVIALAMLGVAVLVLGRMETEAERTLALRMETDSAMEDPANYSAVRCQLAGKRAGFRADTTAGVVHFTGCQ